VVDTRGAGSRRISWPLLVLALLCLLPVVGGVLLIAGGDGGGALGWGLIGFFGAGVFALGRQALWPR
jgi:lipopolysaccharide export LptBFGC system permease protein LptF